MEQTNIAPKWMEGGKLNEVEFAKEFLQENDMVSCERAFFTEEGRLTDLWLLRQKIFQKLKGHVTTGVARKVESILATMRMETSEQTLELYPNLIHVANGTIDLNDGFSGDKRICRHRLPVNYCWPCQEPETWLNFLDQLLSPMDIMTLQEYMGYCLIPTTKAQKMLLIIGSGGEGKSRIGVVMKGILGNNLSLGSIAKIEQSPFARADLEHLLVMVDDDMQMEALSSTNYLKSIITAELPMDLERKGEQSYQGLLTVRFLAFGNGALRALHDRSHGFFRRQIILKTLPRDPDRIDDPDLSQKLLAQKDAIFMWCLAGLLRLRNNNFVFTLSDEAMSNLCKAEAESNNIPEFMASTGYIEFRWGASTTSRQLYAAYENWCRDNAIHPLAQRTFSGYLREHLLDYNLDYTCHVPIPGGKHARGFRGIRVVE